MYSAAQTLATPALLQVVALIVPVEDGPDADMVAPRPQAKKSPDRSQGFSFGGLKRNRTAVNGFAIPIQIIQINYLHPYDTQTASCDAARHIN